MGQKVGDDVHVCRGGNKLFFSCIFEVMLRREMGR